MDLNYSISTLPTDNKLYCFEIISTLTSADVYGKDFIRMVGDANGIDALLKQVSFYRKYDPIDVTEAECMQNAYNILEACIQSDEINRRKFFEIEGPQLIEFGKN